MYKKTRKDGTKKMQITDVRLRKKSNPDSRVKAVASVTFDNEFVVHDIKVKSKVVDGEDKLFISMPRKKTLSGEFKDIAHPINSETREKILKAILEVYDATEPEESTDAETTEG